MWIRTFFSLAIAALVLQACVNNKRDQILPACDATNVTYSGFVKQTLINNSCASTGCHDAGTASSGVILDNYDGVKNSIAGGRLMGAITHTPPFRFMPNLPGSPKLDTCTIAKIGAWVANGAPNN